MTCRKSATHWPVPQPESALAIVGMDVRFPDGGTAPVESAWYEPTSPESAYGLTDEELRLIDPQHLLFLDCCVSALAQACPGHPDECIGVYAAAGPSAHLLQAIQEGQWSDELRRGHDKDYLPALVSQVLALRGPSFAIQSASASAIVAVHVACQSLLTGECDAALTGAVSLLTPTERAVRVKRGEGVGALYLKRLDSALDHGDLIVGLILGSAVSHSGSRHLPGIADPKALALAQRGALAAAGVEPSDVGYVEMHSTGTPAADRLELAALRSVYAAAEPDIDSCRSVIPYSGVASGIAALSAAMQWCGRTRENVPYDREANTRPRIAAVNAIGMTGTHAHMIVAVPPDTHALAKRTDGEVLHVAR